MAEGVLSSLAGEMLGKLGTEALKQLGMLTGLRDDLNKLKSNISAIQAVLTDAEERPNKSRSLKDWLQKLEEALYDAEDVVDEISTEALRRQVKTRGKNAKQVRIFFSKSNQLAFNYRMSCKIKKIRGRLDEISAEKNKFGLIEKSEARLRYDGLPHQMGTHSAFIEWEVVGREDDKMRIKSLLLDETDHNNISFIAIVGMGGIGKTTLAKLLYNDSEVSNHFDPKMWIGVSNQFDVKRVAEKMIELASGSKPNVKGIEALRVKLKELIGGKKYLLVLDDIWNESEEKWEQLKPFLMVGAHGSKILITKRILKVPAEVERMTKLIDLKGLSDDSSWSLFQKVAFKVDVQHANPKMIQLGKEILEKCRGIPLVIRHIGRMLYSRFSEEEWTSFKNDELSKVTQQKNSMTTIFELSYKHLPSPLKQCFAYSSLFSKNEYIDKDKLLKQWVAHGFVQSHEGSKSMEDTANEYFTELCWRYFYVQQVNNSVRMHEMMHDLAKIVASTRYARGNLNNDDVGAKIHHVSLDHNIYSWNDLQLLEAKRLRTLWLLKWKHTNEVVLDKLVSNFPRLRVLDLSHSSIIRVPNCLKKLKHLRYLDLFKNDMQSLPKSIGELVNLQRLNLKGCKALTKLPREINKLVNLRHLELDCASKLTHMPKGIGKLTCLQTLSLFVLDENKQDNKLSELNELSDLRGELYIKGLEQLRGNPLEARLGNLKDKKDLRDLVLQWKPSSNKDENEDGLNDEIILEGLELHPNVESVCIWRYKGEKLPNWVANPESKLTHISLGKCNRLQCLPQFHQLPALKKLYLQELTSLQFIDKNINSGSSSSSTSKFFPCLDVLILKNMPNLEGWWEGESRAVVGDEESEKRRDLLPNFARLTQLYIYDCPKLGWVPRQPSLKKVELNTVGARMVRNIGPSSNLEYVKLKNIEDLQDLPRELCSSRIVELKISNCPSLPQSAVPTIGIQNSNSYGNFVSCQYSYANGEISNGPSLPQPRIISLDSNYSYQPLTASPDVIEGLMRKASSPSRPPIEDLDENPCCVM